MSILFKLHRDIKRFLDYRMRDQWMRGFHTVNQCFSNWVPQRGVWESEGRKYIMAKVLDMYVRIKIRVATFDTDNTQTINRCFNPEACWFCSQVSRSRRRVDVLGETIRLSIILRLDVDILHVMYIRDEQILVFNFIFDLLWTDRGFLSKFCSLFLVFLELKYIEKHGGKWYFGLRWYVGTNIPVYTESYHRRQEKSSALLWEFQISHSKLRLSEHKQ
jgi:hypothetical protein